MNLHQIIVVLVILFVIVSLYKNYFGSGFTFIIGIGILGLTGVLTPGEIMRGFANVQLAVIVLLLLIGEVIRKSTLIDNLFNRFFSRTYTYRKFLIKLIFPVAGLSALINNTPLVAILMPYVHNWGKRNNIASSKLLIPLSYATMLGGTATLIGTSTNLMVNGMVAQQNLFPHFKTLNIFDFTPVGLTMAILGGIYLIILGYKLLPDNSDLAEEVAEKSREYMVEVKVGKGSGFHNKTIEEAKLRNLKGLFLVEIIRDSTNISPVSPKTQIKENDLLIFAGNTATIADMVQGNNMVQPAHLGTFDSRIKTELIEIVIAPNSNLITKTVKESNFRARFDAAILAIHRNGEKINGKIGEIELIAGDLLLLITGEDFSKRVQDTRDFFVINNVRKIEKIPARQSILIIGGLIVSVLLSSLNLVPLFTSLLVFVIILLLSRVASPKELHKGINFNLILIIALSIALGEAMIKTSIAYSVSHLLINAIKPYGIITLFAGIFIVTNLLAAVITNVGAAAIVFPVALSLAGQLGLNPKPFVMLVAFAAAASFITPIGYQTNLMVYGPGGYSFRDYFRIGLPLTILFMIVAVAGLILQFGLKIG
ncbi:MAG: SLC13 family permease [Bacteroidales bacterium]|nr:SLC13 family permease [Bacteroidales bacterium]